MAKALFFQNVQETVLYTDFEALHTYYDNLLWFFFNFLHNYAHE